MWETELRAKCCRKKPNGPKQTAICQEACWAWTQYRTYFILSQLSVCPLPANNHWFSQILSWAFFVRDKQFIVALWSFSPWRKATFPFQVLRPVLFCRWDCEIPTERCGSQPVWSLIAWCLAYSKVSYHLQATVSEMKKLKEDLETEKQQHRETVESLALQTEETSRLKASPSQVVGDTTRHRFLLGEIL